MVKWLPILCLAIWPGVAGASDIGEIKTSLTNLIRQVEALQIQTAALRGSLDVTTNSFRNQLASVQNGLVTLKSAVEAKPAASDTSSARQMQFTASLRDLSNSILQLNGMVAELKSGAGKPDYKSEVDRQLAGLNARIAGLTNALVNLKPAGMDAETKENIAFLKNNLARAGAQGAQPVWMNYTLLGLLAVSLGLSGWLLVSFRSQLESSEKRTRELLVRFGSQMEGRVKSMEGSSVTVQNSAREITDFLGRVELAVHGQLETVAQQLNSAQVTELTGGAVRAAEEMALLRAETAELKKFMGDLRQSTERRVANLEEQTGRTLEQIKENMNTPNEDILRVLPAPFRDDGKLVEARERILTRFIAGDLTSHALLLGLAQLQLSIATRDGDTSLMVEALDHLGRLAYRFWKGEPDASVESTFEFAQTWGSEINKLLTENNIPLNIRIIMPRAGFDMGTMLSEHSATGTTTRVREPLSWAVVGKGPEQQSKVLVTGKVITE